ncbi:uncharacterized protein si:ch73-242m19.1 [Pangasianodon hypophthalmus]|uniref:uncharacterized protein si:ch73-242m19.1 n=1 Tax=Pangasianodon hypophthalmus TaxID=310915 RepID=UPI00230784A7|nr:uncharacterized protein si:ch73-242m19.1 [Pangasianodon hypophthalmus]
MLIREFEMVVCCMISRMEIYYLSMRAVAQQMGKKQEYEALLADNQHNQAVQPPLGAMDFDVKKWQLDTFLVYYVVLLRLLESTKRTDLISGG